MCMYVCVCMYVFMYVCNVCMTICNPISTNCSVLITAGTRNTQPTVSLECLKIFIYIYIYRERERESGILASVCVIVRVFFVLYISTHARTHARAPVNKRSASLQGRHLHNTQQTQQADIHVLIVIQTRELVNRLR